MHRARREDGETVSHVGYGGARQAPHGRRLLLPHTLAAQG